MIQFAWPWLFALPCRYPGWQRGSYPAPNSNKARCEYLFMRAWLQTSIGSQLHRHLTHYALWSRC